MEAMRALKRRLSDIVYRCMLDDALGQPVTGPGRHRERLLTPFMWTMRTSGEVGWLRDADVGLWEILRENATPEEGALADRALLVSGDGDAQYWLLDPDDVSAVGEWAAYVWANW